MPITTGLVLAVATMAVIVGVVLLGAPGLLGLPIAWVIGLGVSAYMQRQAKTKRCPECAERVRGEARRCKHCGYRFADV